MNIDTKEIRYLEEGEKPKANEGEVIMPDPFPGVLSKLGVLRVKVGYGRVREFRMKRAERRWFIRKNKLMRLKR